MAVRIPYIPLVFIHHHKPKSTSNRVLMLASQPPPLPIIKLQKVFEDESAGVVCYIDEKGEIICEGYDEGPRLQHQQSCSCHPREGEAIICLLERSLLLVTEGAADKEVS